MAGSKLFRAQDNRLKTIWRMLLFLAMVILLVLPLTLFRQTILQFFGATIVLVAALYLSAQYLDKRPFSAYGLVPLRLTLTQIPMGLFIGSLAVLTVLFTGYVTGAFMIARNPLGIDVHLLILFAVKMLFVSVIEESFFRGYLVINLSESFSGLFSHKNGGLITALVLSSCLFGLAHAGNYHASWLSISFLAINGMVWCVPFLRTGNLGLSIGMHWSWNFTQSMLGLTMSGNEANQAFFIVSDQGSSLVTGGPYGPEAGLLGLLGYAAMLGLFWGYLRWSIKFKTH